MTNEGSRVFEVVFDGRAGKELGKLDKPVARRVYAAVMALAEEPRPEGGRRLSGHTDLWRIRVDDHRVVYSIDDGRLVVVALRVAHRRGVYRKL
ncbi:type II toxin-antitoxin system RelE family toxin [Marinactinospora thermotolerans]|uniref:mRNA interferase RelE/StbE n=1 Tax=Marinactinospora thermotolerans DSM 45154 TaxID=1122192 RepID=A0A1T4T286_9ACTN|nr:type II toxin-antitoxin system RelE/ParE family toxin [Marinactinospora thermotolerans]SKA34361.1 mRNA interferase RelE/StbE [Marinactinospora thermotolerans DSM 45154]